MSNLATNHDMLKLMKQEATNWVNGKAVYFLFTLVLKGQHYSGTPTDNTQTPQVQQVNRSHDPGHQQDDGTLGWLLKKHGMELLVCDPKDFQTHYVISDWPLNCTRERGPISKVQKSGKSSASQSATRDKTVTEGVIGKARKALVGQHEKPGSELHHVPVVLSHPRSGGKDRLKVARLHFNLMPLFKLDATVGCVCYPLQRPPAPTPPISIYGDTHTHIGPPLPTPQVPSQHQQTRPTDSRGSVGGARPAQTNPVWYGATPAQKQHAAWYGRKAPVPAPTRPGGV